MCTQHSQRAQNTEKRDEGRSTQRREMRDGVREGVWEFWTKCEGLRGSGYLGLVKQCVLHLFFFFFLNFGLTRPFRPIRPIRTKSARFGPRRPDSGITTWHNAARTRGLRRPPRVAASRLVGRGCAGLGAASVHPSQSF